MSDKQIILPEQAEGIWIARGASPLMIALATGGVLGLGKGKRKRKSVKDVLGKSKPEDTDNEGFGLWHYWAAGPSPEKDNLWAELRHLLGNTQDMHVSGNGEHPLYRLLLAGHEEASRLWLNNASTPEKAKRDKDSFWHALAWSGKDPAPFGEHLPLDDINTQSDDGLTPVMIALHRGNWEHVKSWMFLGADPDIADDNGRTFLHHVALYGHIEWFSEMQDMGCSDTAKNIRGHTPHHVLQEYRQIKPIEIQMMRKSWTRLYHKKLFF